MLHFNFKFINIASCRDADHLNQHYTKRIKEKQYSKLNSKNQEVRT